MYTKKKKNTYELHKITAYMSSLPNIRNHFSNESVILLLKIMREEMYIQRFILMRMDFFSKIYETVVSTKCLKSVTRDIYTG